MPSTIPSRIDFARALARFSLAACGLAACLFALMTMVGGPGDLLRLQSIVGPFTFLTFSTGAGFACIGMAMALLAFHVFRTAAICALFAVPLSFVSLYESLLKLDMTLPPLVDLFGSSNLFTQGYSDIVTSVTLALATASMMMMVSTTSRRVLGCRIALYHEPSHDLSTNDLIAPSSPCDALAVLFASFVLAFGTLALVTYVYGIETALSWQQSNMALSAAIAATLIGAGIIAFLWGQHRALPLWLAIPFGVGFLAITLSLVHGVQRLEDQRFRQSIKIEAKFLATQIDLHLSNLFLSLDRMADRWGTLNDYAEHTWKRDAEAELKAYPFAIAIEWIDANSYLRWIVPEAGNEKLIGFKLNSDPQRSLFYKKAEDTRTPQITSMLSLLQGGAGFLRFVPLLVHNRFDGMIVCVVSPQLLLEHITALHLPQKYTLTLRDGSAILYTNSDINKADEQLRLDIWSKAVKLDLPGHDWSLTVTPTPEALTEKNSLLPLLVLGSGLTVSFFFAFLIFLALKWRALSGTLRDRNDRLRSIMNNTVEGIITINEQGSIETFNSACEVMFGLPSRDAIGKNVSILMPEPYASQHNHYLQRYMQTGEAKVIGIGREVEGKRKDGSSFPLELSVNRFESRGKVMFCGILRDISERKHLQRMQEEFTAIASHELRTPLTCIRGAIGLLAASYTQQLHNREIELLQIALRNSERLARIINDIVDTEKIKSGKMSLDIKPIDVPLLLKQAIEDNGPISDTLKIPFVVVGETPQIRILADHDRLLQVFSNLLSNAAKFSHGGSEVQISVEQHNHSAKFIVRDFGVGIPEDFRPRIFSKFAQSTTSTKFGFEGSGLGLLITKALVENMGGTLSYSSEPGKGTTFVFDLPCATGTE